MNYTAHINMQACYKMLAQNSTWYSATVEALAINQERIDKRLRGDKS